MLLMKYSLNLSVIFTFSVYATTSNIKYFIAFLGSPNTKFLILSTSPSDLFQCLFYYLYNGFINVLFLIMAFLYFIILSLLKTLSSLLNHSFLFFLFNLDLTVKCSTVLFLYNKTKCL